ncbi:hypothetical protein ARAM_006913 [Aspergillus rambellii]|uniref:2EXR domain-containing protein n=2 Tax=Aspergillus subgen. Nidulantes TaxID=2720870 RepID=A0A0F8U033_9EURO|nr:hypothetical protein ARAM_006913 [Aspergillus rambellii]KKK21424.1 hypothetical protein AOCH_000113 [Aspergillus ochraceoroseus]
MPRDVFPLFARLPAELRRMIWMECLPARIFEYDAPEGWAVPISTVCDLGWTTCQNWKPPVLTRICHESRSIAYEVGVIDNRRGWPRWFSPAQDIAALHWVPGDNIDVGGSEDFDLTPELFHYADHGQGAGIPAYRIHAFHRATSSAYGRNKDYDVLALRDHYFVWIKMVIIHIDDETARKSGLFGTLGDEPVQLIDVADTKSIARFRDLWASISPMDPEPLSFFNEQEPFQDRLQQWCKEMETLWVLNCWYRAWRNRWEGVVRPEDIWLGPRVNDAGESLDMLSPRGLAAPGTPYYTCGMDTNRFAPNKSHPFVRKVLDKMPQFQPRVMFRHCALNCHKPSARLTRTIKGKRRFTR